MNNLLQRLATLALAVVCFASMGMMGAAPLPASVTTDATPTTPRTNSTTARSTTRKARTQVHRRVTTRRYRQLRNPWGDRASYGDPGADDNPMGDDPMVRQAALNAIGRLNGSIVVVDPNSGRILSMVNQKLALTSGFTPCSTFKPVVALAALREGIITPNTKLYVGNSERMNVTEALARSNNLFFLKLGEMLGFKRITEYAQEFGFGEKAGVDVPGESPGVYPPAPPKEGGVGLLAYCGTAVEETALQMAALISAIANGGTLYALQYPRTPEEISAFQPVVRRHLDNLAQYIPEIRDGLAGSVLYGTGRLAYDPALSIYGKTGTCSENGARLGWFMSFEGALQSRYVVVVLLRGGRMMYGPHAAEVAGRVYHDLMLNEHPTLSSRQSVISFGR